MYVNGAPILHHILIILIFDAYSIRNLRLPKAQIEATKSAMWTIKCVNWALCLEVQIVFRKSHLAPKTLYNNMCIQLQMRIIKYNIW